MSKRLDYGQLLVDQLTSCCSNCRLRFFGFIDYEILSSKEKIDFLLVLVQAARLKFCCSDEWKRPQFSVLITFVPRFPSWKLFDADIYYFEAGDSEPNLAVAIRMPVIDKG